MDWKDYFALPAPVRHAFSAFPLKTCPPNHLPARSPNSSDHVLCIFTTPDRAARGRPSFNPTCLKWQTYLKIRGIRFSTVVSSNHAAPGGALPFLLSRSFETVACSKVRGWADAQGKKRGTEHDELQYELYTPLLDHRIRRAWVNDYSNHSPRAALFTFLTISQLCQLYIDPSNFENSARRLYIESVSTSGFIRAITAFQLRRAATTELIRSSASGHIDGNAIMDEAQEALETLSTMLGDKDWFFSADEPGLFDASVFAYTHLLLDDKTMRWRQNRLAIMLRRHDNLIRHRGRIAKLYFT